MDRPSSRIVCGDCVEVMRGLPAGSVDAVVTDPPYGLEFMGKDWDKLGEVAKANRGSLDQMVNPNGKQKFKTQAPAFDLGGSANRRMQDWHEAWAREALRVLKPGGHLLAFGGTRTYHRLAAAIEDAGFEIRDTIAWMYGCLTPDVEVLTSAGWKLGIDVCSGDQIAAWDPQTEAVTMQDVQETFRAPYSGPMVEFKHSNVDQLVTPNHRVYHSRKQRVMVDGKRRSFYAPGWEVAEASTLPRYGQLRLPAGGVHDGPGIGGEDYAALLGWVWTEGGYDRTGTGVRITQSLTVNPAKCEAIERLVVLHAPGRKLYERVRPYTGSVLANKTDPARATVIELGPQRSYVERTWFFSGAPARQVRADLPDKRRPSYELLLRMTLGEKRAFLRAAMDGDGSHNTFEQKDRDARDWFQTLVHLVGKRAAVWDRKARGGGGVDITDLSSYELQTRHLAVCGERYEGDVWCVRVPTGAFLMRRNGKVSVTGNSGFPKSLDVSKAIDKAAGAEREVVGSVRKLDSYGPANDVYGGGPDHEREMAITQPATPEAQAWDGWGTALKPAFEPVVVARKPLVGTVAANVLAHGTGALNIDACRIGWGAEGDQSAERKAKGYTEAAKKALGGVVAEGSPTGFTGEVEGTDASGGRWPANVVLGHSPGCVKVGTGEDGMEVIEAWECEPGCPVWQLDQQAPASGARGPASGPTFSGPSSSGSMAGDFKGMGARAPAFHADEGGASRFFFCPDGGQVAEERPVMVRTDTVVGANSMSGESTGATASGEVTRQGRWPANVVLSHSPGCREVGTRKVKSNSPSVPQPQFGSENPGVALDFKAGVGRNGERSQGHADEDGMETVAAWECVEGCPIRMLDEQTGELTSGRLDRAAITAENKTYGAAPVREGLYEKDSGGASRFLYCAKTSTAERNAGLTAATSDRQTPMAGRGQGGLKCVACGHWKNSGTPCACAEPQFEQQDFNGREQRNPHPTVKPIELMKWLIRLVTPPGGTVLDPFMGSGTTGCAAALERVAFIGIEREAEYIAVAEARIAWWAEHPDGVDLVKRLERERERAAVAESGQESLF